MKQEIIELEKEIEEILDKYNKLIKQLKKEQIKCPHNNMEKYGWDGIKTLYRCNDCGIITSKKLNYGEK